MSRCRSSSRPPRTCAEPDRADPALVLARLRRRAGTTRSDRQHGAAAATLIAVVSGIGLLASDATLERAMSPTGADRPVVRVSHYSISNRDAAVAATAVDEARRTSKPLSSRRSGAPLFRQRETRPCRSSTRCWPLTTRAPWTRLIEGRLPAPCVDGQHCEAVLLSEAPVLDAARCSARPGLELTVVGRGLSIDAVPFGLLDQRGPFGERPIGRDLPDRRGSPPLLLVVGLDAVAASPALEVTGRTYVWTAPLDPRRSIRGRSPPLRPRPGCDDPQPRHRRSRLLGRQPDRHI